IHSDTPCEGAVPTHPWSVPWNYRRKGFSSFIFVVASGKREQTRGCSSRSSTFDEHAGHKTQKVDKRSLEGPPPARREKFCGAHVHTSRCTDRPKKVTGSKDGGAPPPATPPANAVGGWNSPRRPRRGQRPWRGDHSLQRLKWFDLGPTGNLVEEQSVTTSRDRMSSAWRHPHDGRASTSRHPARGDELRERPQHRPGSPAGSHVRLHAGPPIFDHLCNRSR